MIRGWGRWYDVPSVRIERLVVAPVASLMGHTYSYEQVTYLHKRLAGPVSCQHTGKGISSHEDRSDLEH